MASINDVSRLAKVSKATVSRVLSGSRGVKDESRDAVLRAVEKLNYKPNAIAQSLSYQKTHCIGVICATEHVQQATGYLQALEKALSQDGKHLLLRFANSAPAVAVAMEELGAGRCDAVMVVGARFALPEEAKQAVLIDCLDGGEGPQLAIDYQFASLTACHYLFSQQRRKIVLFNFSHGEAAEQVLAGYCAALESAALPYNRQLICGQEESVSVALQTLINRHTAFDALLVTDYIKSREAITLLRRYQRQVPQEVMVFSLDGAVPVVGAPEMPQMAWPLDMLAQRALQLIRGEQSCFPPLRGSLIAP